MTSFASHPTLKEWLEELAGSPPVVVAFSGGPDSTFLAMAIAQVFEKAGIEDGLLLAHFNHAFDASDDRGEAAARRLAEEIGAPLKVGRYDKSQERQTDSVQMNCRRQRYAFLERVARETRASWIATGHTPDDQAETVLMNLLRTGVLASASSIPEVRPLHADDSSILVVRPMLRGPSRMEIRQLLADQGIKAFSDPGNVNLSYQRNAVRHDVFDAIHRAGFKPEHLSDLAEQAQDVSAMLDQLAEEQVKQVDGERISLALVNDAGATAINLAALRRAYGLLGATFQSRGLDAVTELQALIASGSDAPLTLSGGIFARVDGDSIVLSLQDNRALEERLAAIPDELELEASALDFRTWEWGKWLLRGTTLPRELVSFADSGLNAQYMGLESIAFPITVRAWREGDRLEPLGLKGTKKLQDIFTDAKVPRWQRHEIPVVSDQEGIIWVFGHALAERVKVREDSSKVLRLQFGSAGDQINEDLEH